MKGLRNKLDFDTGDPNIFNSLGRASTSEDDDVRKLTMATYRKESILMGVFVLAISFAYGMIFTIVFFLKINANRLPLNFNIVWLPFEDFSLNWWLNYAFQAGSILMVAVSINTYVLVTIFLLTHSCWKVDALMLKVEKLVRISADEQTRGNRKLFNDSLKETVEDNCTVLDWIMEVQKILQFGMMVEFAQLSFVLCMTLYTITVDPSGSVVVYFAAAISTLQVFAYCCMATRLITRIENLSATVYDVQWYNMSVNQQKDLQMVLIMTQRMKGVEGIFYELNMKTFQKVWTTILNIFKLIYHKTSIVLSDHKVLLFPPQPVSIHAVNGIQPAAFQCPSFNTLIQYHIVRIAIFSRLRMLKTCSSNIWLLFK